MPPADIFWFDTHVHLDALGTPAACAAAVAAARAAGVAGFVVPGVDPQGWEGLLHTVRNNPGAWAAPGVHPQAADCWNDGTARRLGTLLGEPQVVAIGEIGLDALVDIPAQQQELALRGQLRLARAHGLPVLIHCRRAFGRLLQILDEEGAARNGGILHAFSGSLEIAREAIRRGFAISFAGPLTYPAARRGPELLAAMPREWVVIETDAPDLAPHPLRGAANHPEYLPLVGRAVATLRGWSEAETALCTSTNARRILRIQS